ncbi:NAD(P)H-quinone oxidoreductase [Ancylobacter dichloromethanicus]|uniref:NAD(P)H quinone oxidoreductase n=1 Tax=Ancylobacter dichloromethanicus TaxID=518825 RepID=A0A9W6J6V5_9HYPH|nr:NAD(P)H-quinone oxidoreductase [Ancylobacter dichloromethanicus]MBS7555302.1 NAD(P)H-quinone oxidoreductase [Ancylobacter dichloromethanicus]GLK70484.1 NAD(P)H quinone oxidoreductase [Ancylobacter dichloromethanicus]
MTELPATMTAIGLPTPGGPEALVPEPRPVPSPGAGEILVKVAAAGVNRPDVMQRNGLYPPPPGASDIPGLEISGEVVALGEGVTRWKLGDKVCALVSGGGYAQYCLADEGSALPVPAGLSMVEAAALPETFFTVWTNVFDLAGLKAGERFLVHGGTSGIGTTAIQLAKAFGATVFTTAGSAEKCAVCRQLGADVAIDYKSEDFVAVVKEQSGGKGVNVILDMVGGSYIARNYEAAAPQARLVQIAFMEGSKVQIDFMRLMLKRLSHMGSTLRSRPKSEKAAIAASLVEKVWPLIEAGTVKPVLDQTFPLEKASEAHARMETSAHIGKIMLKVG